MGMCSDFREESGWARAIPKELLELVFSRLEKEEQEPFKAFGSGGSQRRGGGGYDDMMGGEEMMYEESYGDMY